MDRPEAQRSWPGFGMSVPLVIMLLALSGIVPLAALSYFITVKHSENLQRLEHQRLVERADSLSANIDRDISSLITLGRAMSSSPSLAAGDLAEFHREARLAIRQTGLNIILVDPSMQQVVNTRVDYGTSLPKTSAPEFALAAIRGNAPAVSGIFIGRVSKTQVFNVNVPVTLGGKAAFVMIVTAQPPHIQELAQQQKLPEKWFAAIADSGGKLIATTHPSLTAAPLEAVAQSTAAKLESKGPVSSLMLGEQVVVAARTSALTAWTTLVWAPQAELDKPLIDMRRELFAAAATAFLLSVLLAVLVAQPLANLVRQTLATVRSIGAGEEPPPVDTFLAEGAEINATLADVAQQLRDREQENAEGRALLETLLANIPEGVTIVGGEELRIVENSARAISWLGRAPGDLRVPLDQFAQSFGLWNHDGQSQPAKDQSPLYRAVKFGEPVVDEDYLLKRQDGKQLRIRMSVSPVQGDDGTVIGAVACWRDVTERHSAFQMIANNERRLKLAMNVANMAIVDIDLRNDLVARVVNGNVVHDAMPLAAGAETARSKFMEVIHPDDAAGFEAAWQAALSAIGTFTAEFRTVPAGQRGVWIEAKVESLPDESAMPARLLITLADINARKASEQRLQLALHELTHRAKNLLAIIQSIASQTARRHDDVGAFMQVFAQRIQGLSASHDLLVRTDYAGAPLEDLVKAQLTAFGGVDQQRISAKGPSIVVRTEVMQSLGLALHELATNAVKYGSLSKPEGKVDIRWSAQNESGSGIFRMSWTERKGPRVKKPHHKGFGETITVKALTQVLDGAVTLDFDPVGLRWSVEAPLENVAADQPTDTALQNGPRLPGTKSD
jgi:two-component sensor histidine kinase/PAS domain-containing protein